MWCSAHKRTIPRMHSTLRICPVGLLGLGDDVDAHLHALCRRLGVRALEFGLTCATSLPPHRGST